MLAVSASALLDLILVPAEVVVHRTFSTTQTIGTQIGGTEEAEVDAVAMGITPPFVAVATLALSRDSVLAHRARGVACRLVSSFGLFKLARALLLTFLLGSDSGFTLLASQALEGGWQHVALQTGHFATVAALVVTGGFELHHLVVLHLWEVAVGTDEVVHVGLGAILDRLPFDAGMTRMASQFLASKAIKLLAVMAHVQAGWVHNVVLAVAVWVRARHHLLVVAVHEVIR